jgi:hypothetical protein
MQSDCRRLPWSGNLSHRAPGSWKKFREREHHDAFPHTPGDSWSICSHPNAGELPVHEHVEGVRAGVGRREIGRPIAVEIGGDDGARAAVARIVRARELERGARRPPAYNGSRDSRARKCRRRGHHRRGSDQRRPARSDPCQSRDQQRHDFHRADDGARVLNGSGRDLRDWLPRGCRGRFRRRRTCRSCDGQRIRARRHGAVGPDGLWRRYRRDRIQAPGGARRHC